MMEAYHSMPVQTLYTFADLFKMPENGMHRELVDGELIELPPPQYLHALVAHRIYDLLNDHARRRKLGRTFMELGAKVRSDDKNWVQPDVTFFRAARLHHVGDYVDGAPDLAVEVISPSERARDIRRKNELMLACGAIEVWEVRPRTRTVIVHRAGTDPITLQESDTLTSEALSGATFPVRKFFSD